LVDSFLNNFQIQVEDGNLYVNGTAK
jgi:hypothetical protein